VDGAVGQKAELSDMLWSVAEQIASLASYFELDKGDVIFSGAPEGVGLVTQGQTMIGSVEGPGEIKLRVV
jgi:fumarylpyruvate hydrolase